MFEAAYRLSVIHLPPQCPQAGCSIQLHCTQNVFSSNIHYLALELYIDTGISKIVIIMNKIYFPCRKFIF